MKFITILLTRRRPKSLIQHTCESPSATCLYMLYEIHDGKEELACCLRLHTPQGIYSTCEIKGLANAKNKKFQLTKPHITESKFDITKFKKQNVHLHTKL